MILLEAVGKALYQLGKPPAANWNSIKALSNADANSYLIGYFALFESLKTKFIESAKNDVFTGSNPNFYSFTYFTFSVFKIATIPTADTVSQLLAA